MDGPLLICGDCERHASQVWNCYDCSATNFCNNCWPKQPLHKPTKSFIRQPHEKGDPIIAARLQNILTPPKDAEDLHAADQPNTWFGIARDDKNKPRFEDYGLYATIMKHSASDTSSLRYPQVVSFVGQTGAGKSTLIKILIDQQQRQHQPPEAGFFPSPVIGSARTSNVPTSGDVHLYSDPRTYETERPMLYADCEGFEGGESLPISVQSCNAAFARKNEGQSSAHPVHRLRNRLYKLNPNTSERIAWADAPHRMKREFAVTELYPRLLYTFSDVVVFVLRNHRTFESAVLSKLVTWAKTSMEKSLNQPTLPHAIIAFNATEMDVDEQEWEPNYATTMLMSSVSSTIHNNEDFRALANGWCGPKKQIRTMKDLLECYYSSITVIRIPRSRFTKLDEQVQKLRNVIVEKCKQSYEAKRMSRMLSNSEELNTYLQSAFKHFSNTLMDPFDFMGIAIKMNPIPSGFGDNISKLAVAIRTSTGYNDARRIFQALSVMVASCILLDCARRGLKGQPKQLLQLEYMGYCNDALGDFCAKIWPCSFANNQDRCVNTRSGHEKGHQNRTGKIIGTGGYTSNFSLETFQIEWGRLLHERLSGFQLSVQRKLAGSPAISALSAAEDLHHATLNDFYQRLGGAGNFVSHSTCFFCLRGMAEHPLPCGHVVCTPCVKGYGSPLKRTVGMYDLRSCPLHAARTVSQSPWTVTFKPPMAGARILSLDGGGMRGIVILQVLHSLEKELGGEIPVQQFFDLIVGTSTGGIVALALGVKNWPVSDCIDRFSNLVNDAFTRKALGGWKTGRDKYQTGPLTNALKGNFGEELLFGGGCEASEDRRLKVAVTSSSETGDKAVIFANYSRRDDNNVTHRLQRPDNPKDELTVWEAARATSAAPGFFRPFVHSRTAEGFIDGAMFHNNPVRIAHLESKLLWPDIAEYPPDILLSIGTGQHRRNTPGEMATPQPMEQQARRNKRSKKPFSGVVSLLKLFFTYAQSFIDTEQIWQDFHDNIRNSSPSVAQRYIRVNPQPSFPTPKMDAKGQFNKLSKDIRNQLEKPDMKDEIVRIAYRLVASCFYFEIIRLPTTFEDHFIVEGNIHCRFAKGSRNLRAFGRYLKRHLTPSFQPYFSIRELKQNGRCSKDINLTWQVISFMIDEAHFRPIPAIVYVSQPDNNVAIDFHLEDENQASSSLGAFPISGFPRPFVEPVTSDPPEATKALRDSGASTREGVLRERPPHPQDLNSRSCSATSDRRSNSSGYQLPTSNTRNHRRNQTDDGSSANHALRIPIQRFYGLDPVCLYDAAESMYDDNGELSQEMERREREVLEDLEGTDGEFDEHELQRAMFSSLLDD